MPCPAGAVDAAVGGRRDRGRSTTRTAALYGYDFAGEADQQVEWVNLRVTGIGPITAARDPRRIGRRRGRCAAASRSAREVRLRRVCRAIGLDDAPSTTWLAPGGRSVAGPAVIEEFGSTVPIHPGFTATVDAFGNLVVRAGRPARGTAERPMTLDWVPVPIRCWSRSSQGTLASVEAEVETAIGRTARSPMIRDAHDFRAGIHDRRMRKLTGRSYSALVHRSSGTSRSSEMRRATSSSTTTSTCPRAASGTCPTCA